MEMSADIEVMAQSLPRHCRWRIGPNQLSEISPLHRRKAWRIGHVARDRFTGPPSAERRVEPGLGSFLRWKLSDICFGVSSAQCRTVQARARSFTHQFASAMRGDLQDGGGILFFTIPGGDVCCRNDGYDAASGLKDPYQVDLVRIGYAQWELRVHELTQHIHAHFNTPNRSRTLDGKPGIAALARRSDPWVGVQHAARPRALEHSVSMDDRRQFESAFPAAVRWRSKEGNVQRASARWPVTYIGPSVQKFWYRAAFDMPSPTMARAVSWNPCRACYDDERGDAI